MKQSIYSVHLCGDDYGLPCKDVEVSVNETENPVYVALDLNPEYKKARVYDDIEEVSK